jgi:hypothetical protein
MKDIFGRPIKAGDKVAVGMSYGQSSVLRVGEVLYVREKVDEYRSDRVKWSVRVKWTHNGSPKSDRWTTRESTILGNSSYTYAKLIILPDDFVEQFPPDNKDDE